MRRSGRNPVPPELALPYEFVNSLDLRRFVEQGKPHPTGDEIGTPVQLRDWMRTRGLLARGATISADAHRNALQLRRTLRDFIGPCRRRGRNARNRPLLSAVSAVRSHLL
jgi:hypothetical protein